MTKFNRTLLKTKRARQLRIEATGVERKFWARLRGAQMEGYSFRRQHPVGPFIIDFYCPPLKLAIELDGGQHAERRGYDAARTCFLETKGICVARFWNTEIVENVEGILAAIYRAVIQRSLKS